MADPLRIDVDDAGVAQEAPKKVPPKEGELDIPEELAKFGTVFRDRFTQRAGLFLAKWTGILIGIVTLYILIEYWVSSPKVVIPSGLATMKPEDAKAYLDNVKEIYNLSADRSLRVFDTVIARSLLPVFTGILGYIFGTSQSNDKQKED